MSWEKELLKWKDGRIPAQVPKEDILSWLREDPIWGRADKVTIEAKGSHEAVIFIKGIEHYHPKWTGGVLAVSTVSGRFVKKWIVEQLIKGYIELEKFEE